MSDLHRAISEEIDAFSPDRTPPVAAIWDRKRSRDRRRYALAGAALSVVAVSGIALASTSLGGAPDTTTSVADGRTPLDLGEPVVFDVRPMSLENFTSPLFGVGVEQCVRLPGTSALSEYMSTPVSFQVTVTGSDAVAAFRSCIDQVVGYQALVAPEIEAPAPIPVPLEATGAQVCLLNEDCAVLGETAARELADLLLQQARQMEGPVCFVHDVQYTITFVDRFKQHAPVAVPRIGSCAPVTLHSEAFEVPDSVKEHIARAHQDPAATRTAAALPDQ